MLSLVFNTQLDWVASVTISLSLSPSLSLTPPPLKAKVWEARPGLKTKNATYLQRQLQKTWRLQGYTEAPTLSDYLLVSLASLELDAKEFLDASWRVIK